MDFDQLCTEYLYGTVKRKDKIYVTKLAKFLRSPGSYKSMKKALSAIYLLNKWSDFD